MDLRTISAALFVLGVLLLGLSSRAAADTNVDPESADYVPVTITITDAESRVPVLASVYLDDQMVAVGVSEYTLQMAVDGQPHELVVLAPEYKQWSITISGELRQGRRILGPVKLIPMLPRGIQASRTPALAMAWLST